MLRELRELRKLEGSLKRHMAQDVRVMTLTRSDTSDEEVVITAPEFLVKVVPRI